MRSTVVALLIGAAALAAPAARASAQATAQSDSALNARAAAVSAQLRCPICRGESILDSPAELAAQMRAVVREQLAAGRTPDEVKAYFVSKYGIWILLAPPASGFSLLAYVLPWLAVAGGLAVVVFAVRRWTRPAPETPAASA